MQIINKKIYSNKNFNFCLKSKTDLLKQIDYIKYGKEFDSLLFRTPKYYTEIELPKKGKSTRTLSIPNTRLKEIQNLILKNMLEQVKLHGCVVGGVKNKSIIDNALMHAKNKYLINMDIKKFFPSIHYTLINKLFLDLGSNEHIAKILTQLTTYNYCLPQGAPTSPYLANLVLNNLDYRFYNLSRKFGITYTRYFDDISLSGSEKIIELEKIFKEIISEEGYKIKIEKVNLFKPGENKEITGLIIDNDGNLSLKKQTELEKYLKEIIKKGIKALNTDNIEKERLSINGKINFIKNLNIEKGKYFENIYKKIDWYSLKY